VRFRTTLNRPNFSRLRPAISKPVNSNFRQFSSGNSRFPAFYFRFRPFHASAKNRGLGWSHQKPEKRLSRSGRVLGIAEAVTEFCFDFNGRGNATKEIINMVEILMTLRDVAAKSGTSYRNVQRHVAAGKLRTRRLGEKLWVVEPQEFERWFCEHVAGGRSR
jgi:hypothetical protein